MFEHYINDETIVIELPKLRRPHATDFAKTFHDVAESRAPKIVGHIPNIDEFRLPLGWPERAPKQEFFVKAPGTHVILPLELRQFAPTLKKMLETRYSQNGPDDYCILGVVQSRFDPDKETSDPFIQAHKDLTLKRLQKESIPNCSVMIACDTLATGFSTRSLSFSDIHAIETAPNPDQKMQKILSQWDYQSCGPGLITEHDITTAHALANPKTPTVRTALIANFTTDAQTALALKTTPGLRYFDRGTWENDTKQHFVNTLDL